MLPNVAHTLLLLTGFKRAALTFGLGALAAFSMPPYGIFPVLFVSFTGLFWLLQGAATEGKAMRTSAWIGWCFGFGYHVSGLWWLGAATLVEPEKFAIFLPFAVFGLPAGLGIFTALAAIFYAALKNTRLDSYLSFALAFFAFEFLRGHILTGFPWNLYGYGLTQFAPLAQSASIIGVYGLTFLTLLIFVTPAFGKKPFIFSVAGLVLMAGFGTWRLTQNPTRYHEKIALRLVQPNVPQEDFFSAYNRENALKNYLELSDKARSEQHTGMGEVTHLIWPESPFPFYLAEDSKSLALIAKILPPKALLLTGALRREAPLPGDYAMRVYNSLFAINNKGEIVQSYDKVHLVPFGEYLPFQKTLESWGLEQLSHQIGGFQAGSKRARFELPNTPAFTPLICYEIVFPSEVLPEGKRPEWVLNVTNDAWFGMTPGPYQHLHMAQVRAIEEGVPVVRVANNGVSGVIDALGRITSSLNLSERDVLDSRLPLTISQPQYSLFGKSILFFLISLAFLCRFFYLKWSKIRLKR